MKSAGGEIGAVAASVIRQLAFGAHCLLGVPRFPGAKRLLTAPAMRVNDNAAAPRSRDGEMRTGPLEHGNSEKKTRDRKRTEPRTPTFVFYSLLAGGLSGCVAKTIIAPFDRVKILFQTHNPHVAHLRGECWLYPRTTDRRVSCGGRHPETDWVFFAISGPLGDAGADLSVRRHPISRL